MSRPKKSAAEELEDAERAVDCALIIITEEGFDQATHADLLIVTMKQVQAAQRRAGRTIKQGVEAINQLQKLVDEGTRRTKGGKT